MNTPVAIAQYLGSVLFACFLLLALALRGKNDVMHPAIFALMLAWASAYLGSWSAAQMQETPHLSTGAAVLGWITLVGAIVCTIVAVYRLVG